MIISLVLVGVYVLLRQRKRAKHKVLWLADRERAGSELLTPRRQSQDVELDRLVEHVEEFDAGEELDSQTPRRRNLP